MITDKIEKLPLTVAFPSEDIILFYRPPFNWETVYATLKAHYIPGLETVENGSWARHLKSPDSDTLGKIMVANVPEKNCLEVKVTGVKTKDLLKLSQKLRKMFDLDSDPLSLGSVFSSPPVVAQLFAKHEGLRVLTGWDAFETAVGAILGQVVSVSRAQVLLSQLICAYGTKAYSDSGKQIKLFPSAQVLSRCDLNAVQTTGIRKDAIRELSKLICEGRLNFDDTADLKTVRETLSRIKGVGPWTVEYICLRALGDTDAFPAKDLIIGRVLTEYPDIVPQIFSPYRGYLCLYLWREFASLYSKQEKNKNAV